MLLAVLTFNQFLKGGLPFTNKPLELSKLETLNINSRKLSFFNFSTGPLSALVAKNQFCFLSEWLLRVEQSLVILNFLFFNTTVRLFNQNIRQKN